MRTVGWVECELFEFAMSSHCPHPYSMYHRSQCCGEHSTVRTRLYPKGIKLCEVVRGKSQLL
jgi:hypothetical protein